MICCKNVRIFCSAKDSHIFINKKKQCICNIKHNNFNEMLTKNFNLNNWLFFRKEKCLCFHYIASTIPLLSKSKISSFYQSSVVIQPCVCQTWSETLKTAFIILFQAFSSNQAKRHYQRQLSRTLRKVWVAWHSCDREQVETESREIYARHNCIIYHGIIMFE